MGWVDGQEEALGGGEDAAFAGGEGGDVEELAALASEVVGGEGERDVQGGGAEVVDLHVAGHGEDVQGAVKLGHGLVEEGGDDAAVDVAGRALVNSGERNSGRGGDVGGVFCGDGEG